MSFVKAPAPECSSGEATVELMIVPKERDLGELTVKRVLPAAERRMVGPFIFFDHMGPADFAAGEGIDVRPHPHIGIATITYLFEGEIMHRDSLGYEQAITAGAVNLMTAGRGIVHSERAGSDLDRESKLHGIQSWIALPDEQQEIEPAFVHAPAAGIPNVEGDGWSARVILGEAFGVRSPVETFSPTVYAEFRLSDSASLVVPRPAPDVAAYVVSGRVAVNGHDIAEAAMAVFGECDSLRITAETDSRLMLIGGEPVGKRHIWWNFVSSSRDRIEAAKQLWASGGFDRIEGDDEFIPLPDA